MSALDGPLTIQRKRLDRSRISKFLEKTLESSMSNIVGSNYLAEEFMKVIKGSVEHPLPTEYLDLSKTTPPSYPKYVVEEEYKNGDEETIGKSKKKESKKRTREDEKKEEVETPSKREKKSKKEKKEKKEKNGAEELESEKKEDNTEEKASKKSKKEKKEKKAKKEKKEKKSKKEKE
eukprot:TRINITY_DN6135_c0_g1_i1.p1 TRINITY_DN6135_c0_g1~~TRINITY_DN6135_c0_g1_i1.p1  ORF type:complete len:177 (-),score=106.02 TRINITY_DN6135_c0_g1_i1:68-598(-)